jgi:hypothetical protein
MPAVAAVHFLANRDAHADRDPQHFAQPAAVHNRSDHEHLKHGYLDREYIRVGDAEHHNVG